MTTATLVFRITEASELEDYGSRKVSANRGSSETEAVARAAVMATERASLPQPRRVFRDAGVFEEKHRRFGLHLIFETDVAVDADDEHGTGNLYYAIDNAMARLLADEDVVSVNLRTAAELLDEEVYDLSDVDVVRACLCVMRAGWTCDASVRATTSRSRLLCPSLHLNICMYLRVCMYAPSLIFP